jgi:hypothetical protein
MLYRMRDMRDVGSMNLRNMTQTSMGRRSRSPESPLSLRMISRQDNIPLEMRKLSPVNP